MRTQRTFGYLFHCHSQEETHLFALVPSRVCLVVLLAFLCLQGTVGDSLLCHELWGPFHVRSSILVRVIVTTACLVWKEGLLGRFSISHAVLLLRRAFLRSTACTFTMVSWRWV